MTLLHRLLGRSNRRARRLAQLHTVGMEPAWSGLHTLEPRQLMSASVLEFRSIDGTGNNLSNLEMGSTGELQICIAGVEYGDGISTPGGEGLPGAREVSNAIVAGPSDLFNGNQLSAYIYAWGQFIDHDIDLTVTPSTGKESFNIPVPTGDPYFDPDATGTQVIPFTRSAYDPATGTGLDNPRQQMNEITAWIDGSMVYGSDAATAAGLRSFAGGLLRTSAGNLLPVDDFGMFMAGDVRANENIGLTSMHTLFVREHNRLAAQIAARDFAGKDLSDPAIDEAIYQSARRIVGAEIQAITFNEFLPALLGKGAIKPYRGYDASVDPSVATEFSTAGFRLGHSLINDTIGFIGDDGQAVREGVALSQAFFNPDLFRQTGSDSILKFFASTQAQEMDPIIVDSLRNFLFGLPGQGGFDLAALNIQRGRDHGLADYNTTRQAYGLPRVTSFEQITSDPHLQEQLRLTYGDVDHIDLWVGALAEDHVKGATVGSLVQAIVADQFTRLRDGDRLWYQRTFSGKELKELEKTTLADIIKRNTTITNLQDNVFFMRAKATGAIYFDQNSDGVMGKKESGIEGVLVELVKHDGTVLAQTLTDKKGEYSFDQMTETGQYQVRVSLPATVVATAGVSRTLLITRGDVTVSDLDIGIRPRAMSPQTLAYLHELFNKKKPGKDKAKDGSSEIVDEKADKLKK